MAKLSSREKTLVWVTTGSLAVAVLFGGFFWLLNQYNDNFAVLQGIESKINEQENITLQGIQAAKRKRYYIESSLTSDVSDAKNQYIAWLKKTFSEDVGVSLNGVDPGRNSKLKYESNVVAEQMSFSIKPTLTLKQLVKFLNSFYSIDTLHRITVLKLTPRSESAGGNKARTGEISATIEIEVLSLPDGMQREQMPALVADPNTTLDDTIDSIVRRDVFGAANNLPTIKVNKSSSYTSGKPVTVAVRANDADEEDELTMALVDASVEGAELQIAGDPGQAKLVIPGQAAGRYSFRIRVTDNGLPAKSTEEEFQITFKDAKKPAPPKPTPPPVEMALETRITANLLNADGSWSVLIKSRMDGQSYRLGVGDSFRLDDRDWEVTDISKSSAGFKVLGQSVQVQRGVAFSEVNIAPIEPSSDKP